MRALTGAVFVIVLVGSIIWRYESFALLFLLITVLGTWEFYGLAEKDGVQPQKIYGTITAGLMFVLVALEKWFVFPYLFPFHWLVLPFIFLVFIFELYRKKEKPFTNAGYTLLGIAYVALPFSLLISVPVIETDSDIFGVTSRAYFGNIILGYFILMWTSDTGAYLCGRGFGKHKLFERVSPKKTWEGTIGGGLLCVGAACLLSFYFTELAPVHWIAVAIIIVVTGNLGDLAESLFKRSINIKDSGTILPGHGGILDRFDAVLISTPFVFTYLTLVKSLV